MRFNRLDHVAIEVADLEAVIAALEACSMRVVRRGHRHRTGQPIAMVGDGTGVKVELIQSDTTTPVMAHLAFDVDDLDAAVGELVAGGWSCARPPHDLPSAKARTALLSHHDTNVQLISYEPDSPDLAIWTPTDTPPTSLEEPT